MWHEVDTQSLTPFLIDGVDHTTEYREDNVTEIYNALHALGYSNNAIAAMCGNSQFEGLLNPAQKEAWTQGPTWSITTDGGGLFGWTPVSYPGDTYLRHLYEWCSANNLTWNTGPAQMAYVNYELTDWNNAERFTQNLQAVLMTYPGTTTAYPVIPPITASQFITSTLSVEVLSDYWILYYEHPGDVTDANSGYLPRRQAALQWKTFIDNLSPTPPGPTPRTYKKMPIYLMLRNNLYRRF